MKKYKVRDMGYKKEAYNLLTASWTLEDEKTATVCVTDGASDGWLSAYCT